VFFEWLFFSLFGQGFQTIHTNPDSLAQVGGVLEIQMVLTFCGDVGMASGVS